MVPTFKRGDPALHDSWRQLEVGTQFGLLQECIVFGRTRAVVRAYLSPYQSGYVRDVADAHLVLHEFLAEVVHSGRCAWGFFGRPLEGLPPYLEAVARPPSA